MTTSRPATEVLAWSRELTGPALRSAVETMPAPVRRIAGYHFGWLDAGGLAAAGDGGKALRPALVLLAAEAAGGSATAAVPAAVAVELVHNFSLLHDDVMDGDATRRHRPTAWSVFGVGAAILTGDALLALASEVLAAAPAIYAGDGVRMLAAAVLDLVEGQMADTGFEGRDDVTPVECARMAEAKTGALLGTACALGGLAGGADPERVEALRGFGRCAGLAFQLADDLLGIWGDPAVTGKPVYSDLRNRKKSLPVVAALTSGTPAAAELAALYRSGQDLGPAELSRAAALVEAAGAREWADTRAGELLADALDLLSAARPEPRPAAELGTLARLLVQRDH
ncbi:family 2 encapsulin nanocompartment cargo protein polyprenyl transferase [Sphaerisporangium rufum]|nr:family 2 encapsulin nanocompartment cargo protein polyprenyl transferase [Sphaerisporangium rufum]